MMRQESGGNLFWVSYADLMTALFIVMLALFVLSYKMFKVKQEEVDKQAQLLALRATELTKQDEALQNLRLQLSEEEMNAFSLIQQLEDERNRLFVMEAEFNKLREIQEAISALDPRYFEYQPEFKRHILRAAVTFRTGSDEIDEQYFEMLESAGQELMTLVNRIDVQDFNIKYLMVIEGQASADNYSRNYELSYERALSLYRLWEKQGIRFNPEQVEVIISGSGEGGVGRDTTDEKKNQRFLIQLTPKIGELQTIDVEEEEGEFIEEEIIE